MPNYKDPVKPVITRFTDFAGDLLSELDESRGGFPHWHGHTDARRLALVADYFIQSVTGIADSLADAALCIHDHQEQLNADNQWAITQLRTVAAQHSGADDDAHLAALQRGAHEERRQRRISVSAVHALVHLVQALDRAAAMIVIAGGLKTNVLKVGWGHLAPLVSDGRRRAFDPPANPTDRDLQREYVEACLAWSDFGPEDWLPWMIQTRHASAHRAPVTSWNLLEIDATRRTIGIARPFLARPANSEMHSYAMEVVTPSPLPPHVLPERGIETLTGLLASTADFLQEILNRTQQLWELRRGQPSLIIQSGKQWQLELDSELNFHGYGGRVRIPKGSKVYVAPDMAERLKAAHVMDGDRQHFWQD